MAAQPESGLSVRFNLLGRTETRFKSWEIDSAYLVATDGFHFDLYPARREDGQGLEMQPCELLVGGASQVLGRIDKTRVGHDGSVVTCEGRDYIADLIECNIDPNVKVAKDDELADALLAAMSPCGIMGITDFENISTAEVRSGKSIRSKNAKKKRGRRHKLWDYKPKPGEGIYEYCNRLVARQGATLQPTADRTEIAIDAPDYTTAPQVTLQRSDDPNVSNHNNIVSGTAERDYSKVPTFVIWAGTIGQLGEATKAAKPTLFKMTELAEAFNSEMGAIFKRSIAPGRVTNVDPGFPGLLYRMLYHRDQESRSEDDLFFAAKRAIADRLKDTLQYTCTVKGHADPVTGAIISVNTMANVNDDVANVHEPLWIARRTLRYSETDGAMTDLELWRPESFQIEDTSGG